MSDLLWQDAAWRSANEARNFTKDDGPNSSVTPILARLLDQGYISGQIIAISRLLEPSDPKHPKKAVVSLRRIVDEMRAVRPLFTRENFVAQDALPYEWDKVRRVEIDGILAEMPESGVHFGYGDTSGPKAWDMAQRQHELFDQISGVGSDQRSRNDLISEAFFDKIDLVLEDQLLESIRLMRNKTVAHAADEHSRSMVSDLRSGVTLDEFAKAHYLLSGAFQAISVVLFGQWRGGGVPVPQFDQFAHMDQPFVPSKRMPNMREFWDTHCKEREDFLRDAYHEIIPER